MTTKFMTNMDSYFYNFLQEEARKKSITKRELLESIIAKYMEWKEQEDIKKQYEKMGQDPHYLDEMQQNTSLLGTL